MFKTALISTFITLAGLPALGQDMANPAPAGSAGIALCPEVVQGLARLRQYGHRYDRAIELTLAEADRPSWGWDGCEDGAERVVVYGLDDPAFEIAARQ